MIWWWCLWRWRVVGCKKVLWGWLRLWNSRRMWRYNTTSNRIWCRGCDDQEWAEREWYGDGACGGHGGWLDAMKYCGAGWDWGTAGGCGDITQPPTVFDVEGVIEAGTKVAGMEEDETNWGVSGWSALLTFSNTELRARCCISIEGLCYL